MPSPDYHFCYDADEHQDTPVQRLNALIRKLMDGYPPEGEVEMRLAREALQGLFHPENVCICYDAATAARLAEAILKAHPGQ
jgi:hypothetical protein